ncbi:choice-of-anchor D domain-containing protein [Vulgatibacter sp.]|uniref:choice-of-anchor D domain-containing protein n=1 Tax=Vulgatibacter sp. TaxID=1971226 RepID=UPI003565AC18
MRTLPAAALVLALAACGSPADPVAAAPVLLVDLVPTEHGFVVDFGAVPLGTTATREITLRADGTGELHLEPPTAPAPFAALLDDRVVAPGESTTLHLRFTPLTPGQHEAVIDLRSDAEEVHLLLRGSSVSGEPACLDVDTTDLTFDPVQPGCSAPWRPLTITNRCDVPASVSLAALPTGGPFALVQHPLLPHWLAPGASFTAQVGFSPDTVEEHRGILLTSTGQGAAREVPLHATASPLAAVPMHDRFAEPENRLDVLFVVDDAASMGAYTQHLAGMASEWSVIAPMWSELRFAVTTTSLEAQGGCGGEAGRLLPLDGTRPSVLTLEMPQLEEHLAANLQPPACRSGSIGNRGLETAVRAAEEFARPGIPLLLLLIATEDDMGPEPVNDYVFRLQNLRRGEETRVAALVAPADGSCLPAADGTRYRAFTEAFHGVDRTICHDWDWSIAGGGIFTFRGRYLLRAEPLDLDGDSRIADADLEIRVDAERRPSVNERGTRIWQYLPDLRAIEFFPLSVPGPGSVVEVDYTALEEIACPSR